MCGGGTEKSGGSGNGGWDVMYERRVNFKNK